MKKTPLNQQVPIIFNFFIYLFTFILTFRFFLLLIFEILRFIIYYHLFFLSHPSSLSPHPPSPSLTPSLHSLPTFPPTLSLSSLLHLSPSITLSLTSLPHLNTASIPLAPHSGYGIGGLARPKKIRALPQLKPAVALQQCAR